MKFFLDTASLDEITYWSKLKFVDGVTTNPSLLSQEKNDSITNLKKITKIIKGPVSAQVTFDNHLKMIKQGLNFSKISKNIVVKLPSNIEGLKAAKELKKRGKKINVTVGFNPAQIIAFARLNVDYFSLIYGKTEDWGFSNLESIHETKKILLRMGSKTKLLVASLRNPEQFKNAIINGADVVTVPPSTLYKTYSNKYSELALKRMMLDWSKVNKDHKKNYDKI